LTFAADDVALGAQPKYSSNSPPLPYETYRKEPACAGPASNVKLCAPEPPPFVALPSP
jgi:hypothetical protein